jgi:glycogen debranching enzyme
MEVPVNAIGELMMQNRRHVNDRFFTVPSPESYPYQWFWDSCFHAIILSHYDMAAAEEELLSLFAAQSADGMMAHVIYWEKLEQFAVDWHNDVTSDFIQPPIIADTVERLYARSGNTSFLEFVYPKLIQYYDYLLRYRDVRVVDLIGYVNPDESGEDNSPRFDLALDLPTEHSVEDSLALRRELITAHKECELSPSCTAQKFWVEDVALNSYLVMNLESMARLANELGDRSAATRFASSAKRVAAAMRAYMFDGNQFLPLTGLGGSKSPDDTWTCLLPLISQQYTKAEAASLIERELLREDRMWSPFGVSTVRQDARAFDPEEPGWGAEWQHPHWRGPIWMNVHWFLHRALRTYGYHDIADAIKLRSVDLILQQGFREYYHPLTGAGMGAQDFTWGGLVIDME